MKTANNGADSSWYCTNCGTRNYSGNTCYVCHNKKTCIKQSLNQSAWRCPNDGTINYGDFCTHCQQERPKSVGLFNKIKSRFKNINLYNILRIIAIIAVVILIASAIVVISQKVRTGDLSLDRLKSHELATMINGNEYEPKYVRADLEKTTYDTAFSDDDFTTEEYIYKDFNGSSQYFTYFAAVTNNSKATVQVTVNFNLIDSTGSIFNSFSDKIYSLCPGETRICKEAFRDGTNPDRVETTYEYEIIDALPTVGVLDLNYNFVSDTIIASITNQSDYAVKGLTGIALFLDDSNNIIQYSELYEFHDENYMIKPGATLSDSSKLYETNSDSFSRVLVYFENSLINQVENEIREPIISVDDLDIDVFNYNKKYSESEQFQIWTFLVKNNSSEKVNVSINFTGYDSNNNIVCSDTVSLFNLGSGETTFDNNSVIKEIQMADYIKYYVSVSEGIDDYGMTEGLEINCEIMGQNYQVSITNHREEKADVDLLILFFDEKNNIVNVTKDIMYGLKEDESRTKLFEPECEYSCAEVYIRT